jgi:hypothetical protein
MVFNPGNKQSGDLLKSEDWNAAMKEIQRLEQAKVNRNGADTLTGPLTIADALNVTGNVGIGTNNPGEYKLNVQGNQLIQGNLTVNGNVTGKNLSLAAENNKRGTLFLAVAGDYNHALYNNLSNIDNEGSWDGAKWNVSNGLNIRVGSGNSKTTALYINNTGNVGVGTNNPGDYKLNVQGNQLIQGSLTVNEITGSSVKLGGFTDADQDEWPKLIWYRDLNKNWDEGLIKHTSKGFFRKAGYGIHFHQSRQFGFWSSGWDSLFAVEGQTGNTFIKGNLTVNGTGTSSFAGNLTVNGTLTINTGGASSWNRLVVTTTSEWGDGNNQYVTIGAGGATGIMLSNPHVTWRDNRASIRYGRSGGIATGSYWDAGVRQDGSFSFALDGTSDNKLTIAKNGNTSIQGELISQGINVDYDRNTHMNLDGAFYRYLGQVYITVDDNLYIRDHSRNRQFHFDLINQRLNQPSDAKLKKNIQSIKNGLQKILSLRGVTFQWKEDESCQQANSQLGLIAQEVETIFPEIVQIGHDGMKSIHYTGLIAPMIEAIKEQQEQISSLLMRLEEQESNKVKFEK